MAFVSVEGTVASVNGTGSGFRVEEAWEGREGRQSRRYWSVWLPKAASSVVPGKGDRVKVSGMLTAKVSERDPRFVDHTINEARVEVTARAEAAPEQAGESWGADSWNTTDSEPF